MNLCPEWLELCTFGTRTIATTPLFPRDTPPNQPDMPYVTPSTEAFAVAVIESNRVKWPAVYALKKAHPERKKEWKTNNLIKKGKGEVYFDEEDKHWHLNHPKFLGLFTSQAEGQGEFSGWTKEGRKYLAKLKTANEQARLLGTTAALEARMLAIIRTHHGLKASNADEERRKKRRKKPQKTAAEEEEEDDCFDF